MFLTDATSNVKCLSLVTIEVQAKIGFVLSLCFTYREKLIIFRNISQISHISTIQEAAD